jgi:hypothetical protein
MKLPNFLGKQNAPASIRASPPIRMQNAPDFPKKNAWVDLNHIQQVVVGLELHTIGCAQMPFSKKI